LKSSGSRINLFTKKIFWTCTRAVNWNFARSPKPFTRRALKTVNTTRHKDTEAVSHCRYTGWAKLNDANAVFLSY